MTAVDRQQTMTLPFQKTEVLQFALVLNDKIAILQEELMAEIQCVTCGQSGEAITEPIFLGRLEAEVKAKVCKPCWKKWEGMRVMVINEYHINLGDESGRETLKKHMKAFLKLGETADTGLLAQNYKPQG